MKKRVYGKKLSRGQGARKALYRSLVKAVVEYGKIETTKTKVQFVQKELEKLVYTAKDSSVEKRRRVLAALGNDRKTTQKLFDEIAPNFKDVVGGFTKVTVLPNRRGDNAPMARLEWSKKLIQKLEKEESNVKTKKEKKGPKSKESKKSKKTN